MKRFFTLLLIACLCFPFLAACENGIGNSGVKFDLGYDDKALYAEADGDGTFSVPATPTREGYAFRGWFTEPDGKGTRVVDATPTTIGSDGAAVDTVYAYWTEVKPDVNQVKFIAFSPYPHIDYADETTGKVIGYRAEEEDFRLMKEFGVDGLLMDYIHDGGQQEEDSNFNIRMAQQYGLDFFVCDNSIRDTSLSREELDRLTEPYRNLSHFVGFYLGDEPGYTALREWVPIAKMWREAYPDKDVHVDLCSLELIGPETNLENYYNYFLNNYNLFHMASDPYPFGGSAVDSYLYEKFYTELLMLARSARKGENLPAWGYVQVTNGIGDALDDMRYVVYADLAFGFSGIVLFNYNNTHEDIKPVEGESRYTMFNSDGTRNAAWYAGQQVLEEVRYFQDVFEKYDWVTGGAHNRLGENFTKPLKNLTSYKGTAIEVTGCNDGLIVSEFEETNGDGAAFMLFNAASIPEKVTETVTFKIPGASSVTLYLNKTTTVLTPNAEGVYTVEIPCAMAAFLTVEYYQ